MHGLFPVFSETVPLRKYACMKWQRYLDCDVPNQMHLIAFHSSLQRTTVTASVHFYKYAQDLMIQGGREHYRPSVICV